MSDAERDGYIRRLRFPRELERQYQADFSTRHLPLYRWFMGIGLAVTLLLIIRDHLLAVAMFATPAGYLIALSLMVGIALSYWKFYVRIWQPYSLLTGLITQGMFLGALAAFFQNNQNLPTVEANMSRFIVPLLLLMMISISSRLAFFGLSSGISASLVSA